MLYTFGRSALCNDFPKKTVFVAITLLYNPSSQGLEALCNCVETAKKALGDHPRDRDKRVASIK